MKSIAVVSGSQKFDGIYQTTVNFISALQELGYDVKTYQLVDPGHRFAYGEIQSQRVIKGMYLPLKTIEMGVNRLFIYPTHISKLSEDEVLLCDTTLASSMRNMSRATIRVQDMRPLSGYRDNLFTSLMFKHVLPKLNKARRLIVETDFVEKELVSRGIHQELICKVPPASTFPENPSRALEHIRKSVETIGRTRAIRCFYVATDRPYKNLRFFIELVKHFLDSEFHDTVSFSLLSKLHRSTANIIRDLHLSNLTVFDHTDDLETYYSDHDILVFPSLYEGFGLPIIEAMSIGIPSIVSNLPPMAGIVQGGGVGCEPNNIAEWTKSILRFTDPSYYAHVAQESLRRYTQFSGISFKNAVSQVFRD